ncbi:MAG TPA: hypothetical protein VHC44_19255 [Verrucomicrobiae bacterium]|nr:hypothetical protein [Verrucomicrobiae bacterium]
MALPILSGFSSYCVACSASGSNVIAAANGGPSYFSTNSGANWSTASAPNTNWWALASSASGERMVAAVINGQIYFSTNFGASWMPTNLPSQRWQSVCVSADGQSIGATGTNSYISRDGGANWLTNRISGNSINCSADGATWGIAGAQLYISSDGGATWSTNFSTGTYIADMSADGGEIAVKGSTNAVGFIIPSPQLAIRPTNNNFKISWLLPSTNFVLQQSADIAAQSWASVPSNPTLNDTNLQQQVTVPATESNAFFRLIMQ